LNLHDVIAVMLYIREKGPVGRYSICKALGMREGVVRGLLMRLHKQGLLDVLKAGVLLSKMGKKVLNEILTNLSIIQITEVDLSHFTGSPTNLAAHIRPPIVRSRSCIEERDLAVRFGAKGAVILVYSDNKLKVPAVYDDLSKYDPNTSQYIFTKFKLSNGDHIIIVFNNSKWMLLRPLMFLALKLKGYF